MPDLTWSHIGSLENIPLQGARRLCMRHLGRPIAVFRTTESKVFAIIDECPHRKGPLSEGIVSGSTVTCPLHNWGVELTDGHAIAPDEGRVDSFAVKIIDGEIHIGLPGPSGGGL